MEMASALADVFRSNVRGRLQKKGWTQAELAKAMGVSAQYLSHLMTGFRDPGLTSLERAAKALDVSPSQLLSEKS